MTSRIYVLALLSALFVFTQPVCAQSTGKKFTAGLRLGANFSRLDELSYQTPRLDGNGLPVMSGGKIVYDFFQQNDARSTGLVGGVFARIGNRVFIQPEVLLSVKGGKIDLIRQGMETQSIDLRKATIDIPVMLGFRLGPLRLNAGPMASLTMLDSGNLKETLKHYSSQSLRLTSKEAQLRYQAGIGLNVMRMQLDLRYEGGLGDLKNPFSMAPAEEPAVPRANLWQLTVGFGL